MVASIGTPRSLPHLLAHAGLVTLMLAAVSLPADAQRRRSPSTPDGFLFEAPRIQLTVQSGLAQVGAGSDLWAFSMDELTLERRDFDTFGFGIDLAVMTSPQTDLVVAVANSRRRAWSEMRDYVDADGLPIEQSTLIERTPLSASLRYYLSSRGRRVGSHAWIPAEVLPWVSIGGGVMQYVFQQEGDFVDYQTSEVFYDKYVSGGRAPFFQAAVGGAFTLTPQLQFTGEFRYVTGSAKLGPDFSGFDRLDLSGASTMIGLAIRF